MGFELEKWERALFTVLIILTVSVPYFSLAQIINYSDITQTLKRLKERRSIAGIPAKEGPEDKDYKSHRNAQDAAKDILIFNVYTLTIILPIAWAVALEDNFNKVPSACASVFIPSAISYQFFQFLMYRVLLSKLRAYDVMDEHATSYKWTWRAVHAFCPVFIIALSLVFLLSYHEIAEYQGTEVCVLSSNHVPLVLMSSLCLIADTVISSACLILIVLSLQKYMVGSRTFGVYRNAFWATVAIVSTFIFLTYVSYVATDKWVATITVVLGYWDVCVNTFAMNLCWPLKMYQRVTIVATTKCIPCTKDCLAPSLKDENEVPIRDIERPRIHSEAIYKDEHKTEPYEDDKAIEMRMTHGNLQALETRKSLKSQQCFSSTDPNSETP